MITFLYHGGDALNTEKLNKIIDGVDVRCFAEIDSTNTEAKRQAVLGYNKPLLIVADTQINGRGRLGRNFYSPKDTGLYMTYLYKPQINITDAVTVTSAAAVAVVRAVMELTDLTPEIKWVNDIYIGGKKVCGILTESFTSKSGELSVAVGIGININTTVFPEDIKGIASSLYAGCSREDLAAAVVKQLQVLIDGLKDRTFYDDYKKYSAVIGNEVVYITQDKPHVATAVDIDKNGGLIVEDKKGNRTTLSTGEISLKTIKNA